MQETPYPQLNGKTVGDVLDYTVRLGGALNSCNDDKLLIERWSQSEGE